MNLNRKLKTQVLVAAMGIAALPIVAQAALTEGTLVGTSETEIRAALETEGFVVTEIESEDGEIEVEATLDGQEYEIGLSAETGEVLEIEQDD